MRIRKSLGNDRITERMLHQCHASGKILSDEIKERRVLRPMKLKKSIFTQLTVHQLTTSHEDDSGTHHRQLTESAEVKNLPSIAE